MVNKLLDVRCINIRGGSVQDSPRLCKKRLEWGLVLCDTWRRAIPWWPHDCGEQYSALLASPYVCLMGDHSKG